MFACMCVLLVMAQDLLPCIHKIWGCKSLSIFCLLNAASQVGGNAQNSGNNGGVLNGVLSGRHLLTSGGSNWPAPKQTTAPSKPTTVTQGQVANNDGGNDSGNKGPLAGGIASGDSILSNNGNSGKARPNSSSSSATLSHNSNTESNGGVLPITNLYVFIRPQRSCFHAPETGMHTLFWRDATYVHNLMTECLVVAMAISACLVAVNAVQHQSKLRSHVVFAVFSDIRDIQACRREPHLLHQLRQAACLLALQSPRKQRGYC